MISTAAAVGAYFAWPQVVALWNVPVGSGSSAEQPNDEDAFRIFAGGTVEGSQREVALRFEIAGRLKAIRVRPGDHVEQGEVLAELDAELWEQKFAEAGTMLKLARAERDRLAHELEGEAHDAARGKLRTSESPIRNDNLRIADSKVALAEGALRRERMMLARTLLRAPTDGIVLRVLSEPGELVGPQDLREVLLIVNRNRTRVRAYVEELDALSVRCGQPALISAEARPEIRYEGVVQSCSPLVAAKSQRHLKPGEFVDLRVREVLIELSGGDELPIGLPVDVFITPADDHSPALATATATARASPPGRPESPR
jgi:multidrug resistance efflux pump